MILARLIPAMERLILSSAALGRALRDARREQGLTQVELAERAGIAQPTISNAERGAGIHLDTLFSMLAVLGLELLVRPRPEQLGTPWES